MNEKQLQSWLDKMAKERHKNKAWKSRIILGVSGSGFLKSKSSGQILPSGVKAVNG